MSLHYLNNEIHSAQTGDATTLLGFSGRIIGSGLGGEELTGYMFHMAYDHIWREYNRKCLNFGLSSYMISPYDGGYRPNVGSLPSSTVDTGGYLIAIDDSPLITIAGDRTIRI